MGVRLGLGILGLYHLANGLVMLAAPAWWAATAVHLAAPDHLHFHFIADIAMAFVASGAGLLLSARRTAGAGIWAVAGATWPALHALIHVHAWAMEGPPLASGDMIKEGVGVIAAGLAGVALAWARNRTGEAS
jgi:hypothetical protein